MAYRMEEYLSGYHDNSSETSVGAKSERMEQLTSVVESKVTEDNKRLFGASKGDIDKRKLIKKPL